MLVHSAALFGQLLTGLVDPQNRPAVFHCHAGKDRTGVVAAVLLRLLGVDRDVVLDDYELTARYRLRSQQEGTFQRLVKLGLTPEAAASVLGTPRPAMAAALDAVDEVGVEGWLLGPAGMARADLDRLRRSLVASA